MVACGQAASGECRAGHLFSRVLLPARDAREGVWGDRPHMRVLKGYSLQALMLSLTRPAAVQQGRGGVGLAMLGERIPDDPDAAAGCTASGASGASTPAPGPRTRPRRE